MVLRLGTLQLPRCTFSCSDISLSISERSRNENFQTTGQRAIWLALQNLSINVSAKQISQSVFCRGNEMNPEKFVAARYFLPVSKIRHRFSRVRLINNGFIRLKKPAFRTIKNKRTGSEEFDGLTFEGEPDTVPDCDGWSSEIVSLQNPQLQHSGLPMNIAYTGARLSLYPRRCLKQRVGTVLSLSGVG